MQDTFINQGKSQGQMWVKPGQLDVGLCGLHHKNKSIVKKTDGGNVLRSSSGWAGRAFVSKLLGW